MRKLSYTYLKPQNYYNRLFTFFLVISTMLTLSLMGFTFTSVEGFLVKFIVIIFLLFFLAAFVEFLYVGEYMTPLEVFDIELFANEFLDDLKTNSLDNVRYFFKYTPAIHKRFDKIFSKNKDLVLSSIRKRNEVYIITYIDIKRMFISQFIHFFSKRGIRKIYVKKISERSYKIIHLS